MESQDEELEMRLGTTRVLEIEDPTELAREHRARGYTAAKCPPVSLDDPAHIRAVEKAFAEEDVVIAELHSITAIEDAGNLIDPDLEQRGAWHEHICSNLALADEVGAVCLLELPGTYMPNSCYLPHPMNLTGECRDLIVERVREVVDAVNPKRTKFVLEMMPCIHPNSPESYAALLEAVDRDGFAVHLDPVNVISSPDRYFDTGRVIKECFDKLGHAIVSCHAKDVTMTNAYPIGVVESRAGTGVLDYKTYLTELSRLPVDTPLLTEHLATEAEYDLARDHIKGVASELGLAFAS